jgi:hypothetical protein
MDSATLASTAITTTAAAHVTVILCGSAASVEKAPWVHGIRTAILAVRYAVAPVLWRMFKDYFKFNPTSSDKRNP